MIDAYGDKPFKRVIVHISRELHARWKEVCRTKGLIMAKRIERFVAEDLAKLEAEQ